MCLQRTCLGFCESKEFQHTPSWRWSMQEIHTRGLAVCRSCGSCVNNSPRRLVLHILTVTSIATSSLQTWHCGVATMATVGCSCLSWIGVWRRSSTLRSAASEVMVAAPTASLLLRWRHTRSEEHTSELQSLMRISYA